MQIMLHRKKACEYSLNYYIRKREYTHSYRVISMSHELDLHIDELREVSEDSPEEMEVVIEMMMEAADELENEVTIE